MNNEEEINSYKFEEIFIEKDLDEIWNSSNPSNHIYEILETYFRRHSGSIDYDSNMLWAMSEFHNNNLVFIKEKYSYPNKIISKLLNILSVLLNLKDNSEFKAKTISQNLFNQNKSSDLPEIDFNSLAKAKMNEIKLGLLKYGFIQQKNSTNTVVDSNEIFYMKPHEVSSFLEYLNNFYFSYFKLYYHFINIERITDNKKIDVIINRPLNVPPLSQAMKQIDEKFEFEEQKEDKKEEKKKQTIDKDENLNKQEAKVEEKKDHPESIEDLMLKYNLNKETENIIREKIKELNKEVDFKIIDRQKKLDEKLKDFEDTIKGKKK